MAEITPLFQQYLGIKAQHPNEVLFFRLGDFYEMFNEDAVEVSRLLNLTLTHKAEYPMCGIPYHAAKIYIARLLRFGKKIAIAEQIGEIAHGKGLTERKVIEIITPGTAVESEYIESTRNNFVASIYIAKKKLGFAFLDVTTGEFKATSFSEDSISENLPKELGRVNPRELLLPENLKENSAVQEALAVLSTTSVSYYPAWNFNPELSFEKLKKQFNTASLRSFSLDEDSVEVVPAGFILDYVEKTTGSSSPHVRGISLYKDFQYLVIDESSRRNLEILSNLRDGTSEFTLLDCLNYCRTAMGNRLLRECLMFPLTDLEKINARLKNVELFYNDRALLFKVRKELSGILDIERLAGRIAMDRAHAKDVQALRQSLILWLKVIKILGTDNSLSQETESAEKIIELIEKSILDDPSTALTEGRLIKEGWSEELDGWRKIQTDFNKVLEDYAQEEREKTGIQNLRIKNNGNMGYFIEVTKGKLSMVPEHFIMRRSLMNMDRYTTARLQELEEKLNESSGKILELEKNLFLEVRNMLKNYVPYLQQTARDIAKTDLFASFAQAAVENNWVKPELTQDFDFDIKDGRHPVVEKHLPGGEFVPNSLQLGESDGNKITFALITGPNMAGKSTFLRQNALISLMAQVGSFVPASYAKLGLVDRIFCRVGASDNLARGESTFLVEMTETAHILRSATEKSLVIMDEVGRGTSTEDGLSIAWAVSEYLLNRIKCKTLFATHYHELTRLNHSAIKMLCMAVNENGRDIVFLRKVIEGASENSYGIHVAKLAGIPKTVIDRSEEILQKIQNENKENVSKTNLEISSSLPEDSTKKTNDFPETINHVLPSENEVSSQKPQNQSFTGALFSDEELILDEILSIDLNNTTPINALQTISRWKKTLTS